MPIRTWREALAFLTKLQRYGAPFKPNECKQRTRFDAYGYGSDGSKDATEAWSRTRHRFHGRWIPGAFIWWTGGSEGHGHVALCGYRKGYIRTVDYPREGHWNTTTVAELERAWPLIKWAGMSLDCDGRTVRRFPRIVRRWSHP